MILRTNDVYIRTDVNPDYINWDAPFRVNGAPRCWIINVGTFWNLDTFGGLNPTDMFMTTNLTV